MFPVSQWSLSHPMPASFPFNVPLKFVVTKSEGGLELRCSSLLPHQWTGLKEPCYPWLPELGTRMHFYWFLAMQVRQPPASPKAQFLQQIAHLWENHKVLEAHQGPGTSNGWGRARPTNGQPWHCQRTNLWCAHPEDVTGGWSPLPSMLCLHVSSGWKWY